MVMTKKLPVAVEKKIDTLERSFLDSGRKKMKLSPAQARTAKKEGQRVLSKMVKLTRTGTPANSVDRAIFEHLKKKDSQIKKEIKKILSKGKPRPVDYYEVYYRVLNESGLISMGQLDPGIFERTRGEECGWCKACSACSSCSLCAVSLTAALGATGAIAGHASRAF